MSRKSKRCGLCKRSPAEGNASVWEDQRVIWLCHGDEDITCYVRWTVYAERPYGGVAVSSEGTAP